MNGKECARALGISPAATYALITSGIIEAEKVKGKWAVSKEGLARFKRREARALERIKANYIKLYWRGLSVEALQRRVRDDFRDNFVVLTPVNGFAEVTIYESLPKRGRVQEATP